MFEIAPSVLAADPMFVARDVKRLLDAGIALLHLDIMDGHFVPNISFGPAMVQALHKQFPKVGLDVHLMLSEPEKFIEPFIKAGADEITIHSEVECDIGSILGRIKAAGLRAGLSIKPATPFDVLLPFINQIDLVLLMSVEPGFGGQKLIEGTLPKLRQIRQAGFKGVLSVDGGVNKENSKLVRSYGATRLVMGTAAFTAEEPERFFKELLAE